MLLSFAMGILVGALYAATTVKSPAPPVVALLGLLGIVVGEAGFPIAKNYLFPERPALAAPAKGTKP